MTSLPKSTPQSSGSLSREQRLAGIAAWMGWLFDGLDGYLYIQVAVPFVMELQSANSPTPDVVHHTAYIQAAFLVGWALGGTVFGRLGDRLGRSRTLSLTILMYALFTGLSSFSVNWQMLLILRFLAALGIGGEWAAGASLVSETWPVPWRPWAGAALQSAFQCGLLIAGLVGTLFAGHVRWVFLTGAIPALLVFWLRKNVPETAEWKDAAARQPKPNGWDLFKAPVLSTTLITIVVCSLALTTTWAYIFWFPQQLMHLPDIQRWSQAHKTRYVVEAAMFVNLVAIAGNFLAGALAKFVGYRKALVIMFAGAGIFLYLTYSIPRNHIDILYWAPWAHLFVQGVFGLFPLLIPPLFPTLLRTTGAGLCYNIGRLAAAAGTVFFGVLSPSTHLRYSLLWVAALYIPATFIAMFMPLPVWEDKQPAR